MLWRSTLIRRLLGDQDPASANRLARLAEEVEPAKLLEALAAEPGLVAERLPDAGSLAARTRRAVCVLDDGAWVHLEMHGDGHCTVDAGAATRPRRMRGDALASWFPCQVLYALPVRADQCRLHAASAAFASYLRFAAQVLGLALPLAMMLIIDKVVNQGARNTLVVLVIGVALLTVFQYLFLWAHARHTLRETEALAHPRRVECLGAVLRTPAAASVASSGWEAMQGASEDAHFATDTRPQLLADVAFVVLLAACMAAFNPWLLMVTLAFVPLYVVAESWGARRALRQAEIASGLRVAASSCYFESVGAARLLHEMALTERFEQRWRNIDARLAAARFRVSVTRRAAALAVEGLQRSSIIVVMLLGVGSVIAGAMTLGQYVAFNLLSMQLAQPVLRLAGYRRAAADRRLRNTAWAGVESRCREASWPRAGARSLPHRAEVSVRVRALVPVAGAAPVDFGVLGGQWIGVVGPSGCGKTTLLRTLNGTHLPVGGEVTVNGVPVRQLGPDERARSIRLVPQEPVIFTAPLAENIALGAPGASPQDIVGVAHLCGLLELAGGWPAHLDTVVGAGGRPLSGGERQRVALARALLCRPHLLLLDEATAALDAAAEALLLERLRRFLPQAAVVVVAHRPTSLRGCGQIVRMTSTPADAGAHAAGDAA